MSVVHKVRLGELFPTVLVGHGYDEVGSIRDVQNFS
jgi:hypothetical protein